MSLNWFKLFENPLKVLKAVGVLVDSVKIQDRIKVLMILIIILILMFMEVKYLFNAEDLGDFSEAVTTFPITFGGLIKTLNFVYNSKKIEELLQLMKELVEYNN